MSYYKNIKSISYLLITCLMLSLLSGSLYARDTAPDPLELQKEEYLLKQRLKPLLIDVLKDEYVALSINIIYVLQHEPIVSQKAQIRRLKLPGFGTQVSITNGPNGISGYIDRFVRYRALNLMVASRLSPSLEQSLSRMLKEREDLNLGGKDTFKIHVVADEEEVELPAKETLKEAVKKDEEKKKKKEVDKLIDDIDKKREEKKERFAKIFPDSKKPAEPVDPKQEAESTKHLILSREAFYKNDLNTALNEVIAAIDVNPYSSKSYEMLGSIYFRLKWNKLALENWEKAFALDPENEKLSKYIARVKKEK